MRKSKILSRMRAGQFVRLMHTGYFLPPLIAYAAHAGYDGVWLDLEHHGMETHEIQAFLSLTKQYDIDCMIRPATREKAELARYFEDGVSGLMFPHVSDVETARNLVNKVRFPPIGDRGVAGFGFETNYGLDTLDPLKIAEHANNETFVLIQIETPGSLDCVDDIAALPGVDGLYIGPADLSLRLVHQGQSVDLNAVMQSVADSCQRHGKAWGIFGVTEDRIRQQVEMGATILIWKSDFLMLREGIDKAMAFLKTFDPS